MCNKRGRDEGDEGNGGGNKKQRRDEWEEEEINSHVRLRVENKFKDLMLFYKNNRCEYLFHVFKMEPLDDNAFYAYTERVEKDNLAQWMIAHPPLLPNGDYDRENFLYPLRELIKNIMAMKGEFNDFELKAENVCVIKDTTGSISFKVLYTSKYTGVPWKCMRDLKYIIKKWFTHHKKDPDVKMFLHSLTAFREKRHFELLVRHPLFLQGRDRKRLFDMAVKVWHMMDSKKHWRSPRNSLWNAFKIMDLRPTEYGYWYQEGRWKAVNSWRWSEYEVSRHPVTHFIERERNADKGISSILRTIRHMGTHVHERLRSRRGLIGMSDCAVFLDDMVPGIFSAIYYVILGEDLATYFVEDNNFW